MAVLWFHREEAEKRQQWLPDKPQRRLPSNKPFRPEGTAPFNPREETLHRLAGRRTHYHTAKRPYPRNPHAIYSASLRRYRKPRKITVAGPSISEVTKRKNPKIRGKRSQGLSQAKLSLQHRGQEHVRSRKTHCLQQVLQRYPHRWNSLLTILPAPSPLHHLPHQSSHTTPCSSLP